MVTPAIARGLRDTFASSRNPPTREDQLSTSLPQSSRHPQQLPRSIEYVYPGSGQFPSNSISTVDQRAQPSAACLISDLLEQGYPVHSPEVLEILKECTSKGDIEALEFLINRGVDINVRYDGRQRDCYYIFLTEDAKIRCNHVKVLAYLLGKRVNFDAKSSTLGGEQRAGSESEKLLELAQKLDRQDQQIKDALNRISDLERSNPKKWENRIEDFIRSQGGENQCYFRLFESFLYSKLFGELLGIKVTLSTFVSTVKSSSVETIDTCSDVIGRSFYGGTIITSCLAYIPRRLIISRTENMLEKLNRHFKNEQDINEIVGSTVFFCLQLFQEQLVLLDKCESDRFTADEEAIRALVDNISSRLISFMLLHENFCGEGILYPYSDPEERATSNSNSYKLDPYKAGKTLALSLTWVHLSSFFQIEYEKKVPCLKQKIITLPTDKSMEVVEKTTQVKDAAIKFAKAAFQGKIEIRDFKGSKVTLTANGFFQKSPWKVIANPVRYYIRKRPDKYPPLCLSEEDFRYIEDKRLNSSNAGNKARNLREEFCFSGFSLKRTTLSHREACENYLPQFESSNAPSFPIASSSRATSVNRVLVGFPQIETLSKQIDTLTRIAELLLRSRIEEQLSLCESNSSFSSSALPEMIREYDQSIAGSQAENFKQRLRYLNRRR